MQARENSAAHENAGTIFLFLHESQIFFPEWEFCRPKRQFTQSLINPRHPQKRKVFGLSRCLTRVPGHIIGCLPDNHTLFRFGR